MGLQEFGRGSHRSKRREVDYAPCWWVVYVSGVGINGDKGEVISREMMG